MHDFSVRCVWGADVGACVQVAESWTRTEAGRKYLADMAEKTAKKVFAERKEQRKARSLEQLSSKRVGALEKKYEAAKAALVKSLDGRRAALRAARTKLESEAQKLSGLARDLKEREADALTDELEGINDADELRALREVHESW